MQQLCPKWQSCMVSTFNPLIEGVAVGVTNELYQCSLICSVFVVQGFVVTHDGYSKTQQAAQLKVSRKFSPPCTTRQAPQALVTLQLLAVLRLNIMA